MNKKLVYIIASVVLFSVMVNLFDAVIHPGYFVKVPIKMVFFLALPVTFFAVNRSEAGEFKKLFVFKRSGLLKSLLLGAAVYAVIMGAYFLLRNTIDFSKVTASLTNGMDITADNFVYVALYISLANSFLEEFFFRGYGFITLKKYTDRKFAYIFSSCVFAAYHVGMLVGMFGIGALALMMFGLIAGGCIFNYLNEKNDNIYSSWFVHMFANFAINTIGMILFGVI